MMESHDLPEDASPQEVRTAILDALYDAHHNSRLLGAEWQKLRDQLGLSDQQWQSAMSYLDQRGLARYRSNVKCEITAAGIDHVESLRSEEEATSEIKKGGVTMSDPDRRKVFVIHGRNLKIRDAMFDFLRSIDLIPLEWSHLVASTGEGSPHISDVLDQAFGQATAVVALFTPDDVGSLHPEFQKDSDPPHEKILTGQARQNVVFETGMAFGHDPKHTVIVEIGKLRPFTDTSGRHTVRLTNEPESRNDLVQRLKACGCKVETGGSDWLRKGDFSLDESSDDLGITETSESQDTETELSDDEVNYLLEISRPRNEGKIPKSGFELRSDRAKVKYLEMLEKFVSLDLMRSELYYFALTTPGYETADFYWQIRILRSIKKLQKSGEYVNENDLALDVELTDGEAEMEELRRLLQLLRDEKMIDLLISSSGFSCRITHTGKTAVRPYL